MGTVLGTVGTVLLTISIYGLFEVLYLGREKVKSMWSEVDNIPDAKESWDNE